MSIMPSRRHPWGRWTEDSWVPFQYYTDLHGMGKKAAREHLVHFAQRPAL